MSNFPYFGGPSEDLRDYERRQAAELNRFRERDQRRTDAYESLSGDRSRGRTHYNPPNDDLPELFRRVRVSSPEPPRRSHPVYRAPSPPPPQRRSPPVFRGPFPPPTFYRSRNADGSGQPSYYTTDEDLPEEFRRRWDHSPPRAASPPPRFVPRARSPPRAAYRDPSPLTRSRYRSPSPPPRRYRPESSRPASPQPHRSRTPSPPPRPCSPPRYTRSPSPPPPHHNPTPKFQDSNPAGFYTYDDEEPDTIQIAPAPWNNNSTSISRPALLSFLIQKGVSKEVAEREVDKEFAAHAPTRRAGAADAGPSMAEMRGRAEAEREMERRWGGGGYGGSDRYSRYRREDKGW
ncbi:hypothetical protein BDZ45DRAFT_745745 [Acephala macrosclerotiorum]|nr:hypothetical protein BDZ45DRAFT_745745 [Acephala macrosclerotiorum]